MKSMSAHTYQEIAEDFELWGEYVDPHAIMTKEEFDVLSVEDKVKAQQEIFGQEDQIKS